MAALVKEVKMNGIEDRGRQTAERLNDCGEQVSKKAHTTDERLSISHQDWK